MSPKSSLQILKQDWEGCTKCGLSDSRTSDQKVVLVGGAIPADYLFIYDAPEGHDAMAGYPFRGKLGGIIEELIFKAEFPKGSYAFAPLVGCWPYTILPETEDQEKQVRDRDPSTEEVERCSARITSIIYVVDPRVIFTIGPIAWKTLIRPKDRGGKNTLSDAAGELTYTRIPGKLATIRYPVMPLRSAKQIQANPSSAAHGPIGITIEAMLRAKAYIAMLQKEESA